MPKYLKDKERLNFRKMISEPTVLDCIKKLSVTFDEDLYKSAYRLMKIGVKTVNQNIENKKATNLH